MKKNTFMTKLFLSCVALSASILLGDHALANSTDTMNQDKVITESTQKLSQLKETKQKFLEQANEKKQQLSNVEKKIQHIQIELNQLEKIESTSTTSDISDTRNNQTDTLTTQFSSITFKEDTTNEKNKQLAELKQKQALLNTATESISKQQSIVLKQETQLSETITQAKNQKTEQSKKADTRSAVVAAAKTHLGKPYVYGAAGPDAFDCSGLVQVAFASAGRALGRTTVDQETAGSVIPVAQAQAGDLVFWGSHGGTYHVGISTGDGSYIHAPVPGDVVQIATVASYAPDFAVQVL